MCTSRLRSEGSRSRPKAVLTKSSRESTRPGDLKNKARSSNSAAVNSTSRVLWRAVRVRVSRRMSSRRIVMGVKRLPGRPGCCSPQHRMNARGEFAWIVRLGQIIIGAEFEPHDAIHVLTVRRQHDNGQRGLGANLAQYFKAANAGQHHIQDHQRIITGKCALNAGRAVMNGLNLKSLRIQILLDQFAKFHVIVDDENARGRPFARIFSLGRQHRASLYLACAGIETGKEREDVGARGATFGGGFEYPDILDPDLLLSR